MNKKKLTFDFKIIETLKQVTETTLFLLIGFDGDKSSIYDILKVPEQELKQDFIDLLLYSLPFGSKIMGLLYFEALEYLENKESKFFEFSESQEESNLQSLQKINPEQSYLISSLFYSVKLTSDNVVSIEKSKDFKEKIGTIYEITMSNINNSNNSISPTFSYKKSSSSDFLIIKNISSNFDKEYYVFLLSDQSLTMQMDSLYNVKALSSAENIDESDISNFYDDIILKINELNLRLHIENKKYEDYYEDFFTKKGIVEYFSNNHVIPVSILKSSKCGISKNNFEETNNTFISLSQKVSCDENSNSGVIKSSKINVAYIVSKIKFRFSIENFSSIQKYYSFMIESLMKLNLTSTYTYSLYLFKKGLLKYYILYSKNERYDEFEENLFSQRKYHMEIHNNSESLFPVLKVNQLEGFGEAKLKIIEVENFSNSSKKSKFLKSKLLLSPHLDIFSSLFLNDDFSKDCNPTFMVGDYLFHHTGQNIDDKAWGSGYRACQTAISWLILNGYINIEIPEISSLQEMLIFLGVKKNNFLLSNKPISLEEIGMILCYLLDIEIEILSFKNFAQLSGSLEILDIHFKQSRSMVLLERENLVSVVFGTSPEEKMIGVIENSYSGVDSLLYLKNSSKFLYYFLEKIFFDKIEKLNEGIKGDTKYNILLMKPAITI